MHDVPRAQRALRGCHRARLGIDDRFEPIEVVIDPSSGCWITPVPFDALSRDDLTLFLPEDLPEHPRVLVEPTEINAESHAGADRHFAYFPGSRGRFAKARWASLRMVHCKIGDEIYDSEDVVLANPWTADGRGDGATESWRIEARLIKRLAEMSPKIAAACRAWAKIDVDSPKVLGVDPWGMDVRASLGPARVDWPRDAASPDDAVAMLEELA